MSTMTDPQLVPRSSEWGMDLSDVAASSSSGAPLIAIDPTVTHPARIQDYYLGGGAYFQADRVAAESAAAVHPDGLDVSRDSVIAHRDFLARVVRWLAMQGICQFLTVDSGLEAADGLHVVAQQVIPSARMVYVDDDPVVLAHAHQAQRTSTAEGRVCCLYGDVRQPVSVLACATELLDLDAPIGVLLAGSLHHLPDTDDEHDPRRVVGRLMDVAAPGSYMALCHLAADIHPAEMTEAARRLNTATAQTWVLRDRRQVGGFLEGLDLVEPGVVEMDRWRTGRTPSEGFPTGGHMSPLWVGVGRKP